MKTKEEKKYYLKYKPRFYDGQSEEYLNYNKKSESYFLSNNIGGFVVKTSFTQKEIEEIKEKFDTDLADLEMIEVEK
ncbi:hypothetical protein KQI68_06855 [Peptoniphilus sp. MSJ-1]|uniref:Phage protein n=1 Tax=Peptoniphilus ovalis TaxID=2841503 RepID=A0ABS6FHP2_9FIRM|nr:hypothetical protein [Peptoniphilus ovalis]MBU5669558.1 hypothetical protein [Peptoniphilus ovalis]